MFQHLLFEQSIGLYLEAPNHEAALAELIALLPASEIQSRQKADLLESLLQRERFGTTAMGDGVAIPHCIFPGIKNPVASFGISRKGIAYPSLDGEPVFFCLLLVFPDSSDYGFDVRRRTLAEAEAVLKDRFIRERIKIADTASEVHEIFIREIFYAQDHLRVAGQ